MSVMHKIELAIHRYDPDTGNRWVQEYALEVGGIQRFTDLFRKINTEIDPTLAWGSSCEHGQCGSCAVRVNGKPLLACELLVERAVTELGGTRFEIAPLRVAPTVRDLVVDIGRAYLKIEKAKPYIIELAPKPPEGNEHLVYPREQEAYVDATRCINCFCCADVCMAGTRTFLGPNAVMQGVVRLMDRREAARAERETLLFGPEGVPRCHTSKACSHVCPKEIDVAHFIALAKEGRAEPAAVKPPSSGAG